MNDWESRALVFGEYLRILYYGEIGDIARVEGVAAGLEDYVERVLKG